MLAPARRQGAAAAADVIVIGAGLAGLAAAHHLIDGGLRVTVVEGADRVGGRMATDTVAGFRLDRSPYLLNTSYPALRYGPALRGLPLAPVAPGALVRAAGRGYRVGDPRGARAAFSSVRAPIGSTLDKARLGATLSRLAATPASRLIARPETTAAIALAGGVSRRAPSRGSCGRCSPRCCATRSWAPPAGSRTWCCAPSPAAAPACRWAARRRCRGRWRPRCRRARCAWAPGRRASRRTRCSPRTASNCRAAACWWRRTRGPRRRCCPACGCRPSTR